MTADIVLIPLFSTLNKLRILIVHIVKDEHNLLVKFIKWKQKSDNNTLESFFDACKSRIPLILFMMMIISGIKFIKEFCSLN